MRFRQAQTFLPTVANGRRSERPAVRRPRSDGPGNAEKVVGLTPKGGTLPTGWNDGLQVSGTIVRVITFQSWFRWIEITGSTLRMSCVPSFGPTLKFASF